MEEGNAEKTNGRTKQVLQDGIVTQEELVRYG